ncbi:MAG TPA: Glu-tRNA(Gln) amidotransferase subunit GatD [Thermoanaerobaculales bacterium]|nr:Glu-tRNA(Gln) amidotransferase subunit GatD [Thermoanaerobaculales bacterium]HPA80009.1 Glu-tRNA(Gln) amidotransferase subunit GatD [Thermoanaerobaculales bacterium]HQL30318.1 Glu-tRNA(Gln) amidotransferase subunit GatD [Thermoanaerobaculales bacterium]HQN95299.1 Glu-tRNA(Gln) amidotransferase subunit GatD [Thermoanaerobaculales bacterium]HQP42330.1 Glu-tRNA(Gln) amidotransferase subunit GatD [Thermoanaerobaculales bacterium]
MTDPLRGYRGLARSRLEAWGVRVWSDVRVVNSQGSVFEGVILPRSESFDDLHLVLKMRNGYNVGVHVDRVTSIEEIGYREAVYKIPEKAFPVRPQLPAVTLLGTGGTIASRLDYRTGAVIPAFTPGELYGAVPELADICNLTTRKLFGVFSENMGWPEYVTLAENIGREIEGGADGVVIGHGTDTMGHTAAILSFMVQSSPVPIVLVGSQRSSDRPSSDAALNLIHAVRAAAYGDIAEVVICMFGPTSDSYGLLHRGTRCRKMHSSYRSTFRTVGDIPLCMVSRESFEILNADHLPRDRARKVRIDTAHDNRVTILYYYPGMHPDLVDALVEKGYRGIVIAGTGLGHVNAPLYPALKRAIAAGVHIVMTVQTLWGYAQMYVYDTGRDLLDIGIVPLDNMLPETALMKLGWVLGHTDDHDRVMEMMRTPVNREITDREPHNGYLILQGGLPEVDEFVTAHWK